MEEGNPATFPIITFPFLLSLALEVSCIVSHLLLLSVLVSLFLVFDLLSSNAHFLFGKPLQMGFVAVQ